MDATVRLSKLADAIAGSGARVNDPFGIDASFSDFSDVHVEKLAGWADLEMLHAMQTRLSDVSIPPICAFNRLFDLSISSDALTEAAFDGADLPPSLRFLGLNLPRLTSTATSKIFQLGKLEHLHLGLTEIAPDQLNTLASIPSLQHLAARNAQYSAVENQELSKRYPNVLMELSDGLWSNGTCRRKWNA